MKPWGIYYMAYLCAMRLGSHSYSFAIRGSVEIIKLLLSYYDQGSEYSPRTCA